MYGKRKSKEFYGSGKASKRRQLQLASQTTREKKDMPLDAAPTSNIAHVTDSAMSSSDQVMNTVPRLLTVFILNYRYYKSASYYVMGKA